MSTRGIVAVGTTKHWRGVYNRFDSNLSALGSVLRDMAKSTSLANIAKLVENTPQGFYFFPDEPLPASSEPRVVASDTMDDWKWVDYVYVIDVDAGAIWGGKTSATSQNGKSVLILGDPDKVDKGAFTFGPPTHWSLLYPDRKT